MDIGILSFDVLSFGVLSFGVLSFGVLLSFGVSSVGVTVKSLGMGVTVELSVARRLGSLGVGISSIGGIVQLTFWILFSK